MNPFIYSRMVLINGSAQSYDDFQRYRQNNVSQNLSAGIEFRRFYYSQLPKIRQQTKSQTLNYWLDMTLYHL